VDELYNLAVIGGTLAFSRLLWWIDRWIVDGVINGTRHLTVVVLGHGSNLFDRYVIDGAVNGVGWTAISGSMMFRRIQSGLVQNYALIMGGGIVLIALVYLFMKP
jgi:NADH-quinone oxidoreductase subunit L